MKLPTFNKQPVLLRATYHINTPMFVAGENTQEAELTPTTFKGVMRFWWRALNWSKIRLASSNKESALKELHQQEAKLFGLASKNNQGGQGECLVNVLQVNGEKKWNSPANKNGVNYLLGQGLYNFKTGLTRSALANNQSFTINLTVTKSAETSIIDVLKLIGLLGGFGSRSRHGFGSVTLTKLEKKDTSSEYQSLSFEQELATAIKALLTTYRCKENEELPPLSAFYQGTRIDIVNLTNKDATELLNKIGEEQQLYRSYGRNGQVNNIRAERNFIDDHDFILNLVDGDKNNITHPKRIVFGLPHNYFYSGNTTRGYSGNVDASTGRRASPLIMHIHQVGHQYQLIHCLLKSEFLPQGATIDIKAKYQREKPYFSKVVENADWQVVETFMNRGLFATKETI